MKAIAAATLAVLFVSGCSSSGPPSPCSGSTSTLTATVEDQNEDPVCTATVTTSGPTQITLTPTGGQGSCSYLGTVKGGGYDVTATVGGNVYGTSEIVVQSGCPTAVEIDMTPAPP